MFPRKNIPVCINSSALKILFKHSRVLQKINNYNTLDTELKLNYDTNIVDRLHLIYYLIQITNI